MDISDGKPPSKILPPVADNEITPTDDSYPRAGFGVPFSEAQAPVLQRIRERIEAQAEQQPPSVPSVDEEAIKTRRARLLLLLDRGIPMDAAERIAGIHRGGSSGEWELADEMKRTSALQYAEEFMKGDPGTLVIAGGVGTGKTIAASWAIAQKPREEYVGTHHDGKTGTWPAEYHPRFRDVGELTLLPRWGADVAEAMRILKRCSVLAVDDVGTEGDEGQFAMVLDAIIVARHDNHLRTILTTNVPAPEFVKRYGVRIRDRLKGSKSGGFMGLGKVESMR